MAASKVSLKLLIDKNENKVLFAEAGKDFIDVLFSLMPMSLAAVSSVLLTKNSMVGSLGNLYHSIDTLSDSYFQTNQAKEYLLKTNTPTMLYCCPNVDEDEDDDEDEDYNPDKDEDDDGDEDEDDDDEYDDEDEGEGEDEDECGGTGGFVKAVVKYIVMDDLVVSPMSTISTITLLNKFGVKGIDALEERVVELGMDEGIKLLKESLQSQTVLTSGGALVLDQFGNIRCAKARRFNWENKAKEIETLSLEMGIDMATASGINHLAVEGDAETLLHHIAGRTDDNNTDRTVVKDIVDRIKQKSSYFTSIFWKWVPRERNFRAHKLAERGLHLTDSQFLDSEFPAWLYPSFSDSVFPSTSA